MIYLTSEYPATCLAISRDTRITHGFKCSPRKLQLQGKVTEDEDGKQTVFDLLWFLRGARGIQTEDAISTGSTGGNPTPERHS